jgi:GNAT superfamily N-acetyltransferase
MSELAIATLEASRESLADFERVRAAVGPDAAPPDPLEPGATLLLASRAGAPVARLSLQVVHDLVGAPGPSGLVGHYEALDAEAGTALLAAAGRALAERRVLRVLGPINGSTWARYRLALRPADPVANEDPAPFLGEPWNPARYPQDFADAGFAAVAHYESRIDEHLGDEPEDAEALAARIREAGLVVRLLDLGRFDQELERLFGLSLECFADNLYYSPIDPASFRTQYEKVRPLIDPTLVLVAEDRTGRPAGFQFAFRDPVAPAPRVIVKTVATAPRVRGLGLGGHMLDLIRRRARELGCGSAIHALMFVKNLSMRMSARHRSRVFRRYALYQWTP